jgi:O-antigen/teichoic acid export membrane protein
MSAGLHLAGRESVIGRSAVVATFLIAARMGAQAIVVISVARLMAADGYGTFAAIVALGSLFAPFSGLGADFIAMRTAAEDPQAALDAFRRTVPLIFASSVPLLALAGLAAHWAFTVAVPVLVWAVLVADILLYRVSELVAKIYQGRGEITRMGVMRLLPAAFRLVGVLGLWILPVAPTLVSWAVLYLVSSCIAAVVATAWLYHDHRGLQKRLPATRFEWRDGLHFAGGVVSARLHTEADKALVMSLAGATGAGIYSAAYRLIEFALVPVAAVVAVAYGRLFRDAHRAGRREAAGMGLRYMGAGMVLGIVISTGLYYLLAPVMVWTVGPSFAAVSDGLPALAALPIAISLRMTGEQNVAALGELRVRSAIQWLAAAAALAANCVLIPRAGWIAAAWVSLVVETALALAYLLLVVRARRATVSDGVRA